MHAILCRPALSFNYEVGLSRNGVKCPTFIIPEDKGEASSRVDPDNIPAFKDKPKEPDSDRKKSRGSTCQTESTQINAGFVHAESEEVRSSTRGIVVQT
jgi:hypothetical protein